MRLALIVTGVFLMNASELAAQDSRSDSLRRAIEIRLKDVVWVPDTTDPPGSRASYVVLHVDPVTQATQMMWRSPPNYVSAWHWHSANETNVIIRGTFIIEHLGAPATPLGPGDFSFVPKRVIHRASAGPEGNIWYLSLDGPLDMHMVPDSVAARRH